jgi:hypothetical protein
MAAILQSDTMTDAAYPLRLTGELAPRLSRWLWLAKMILAVPHYIALVVLWIAFAIATVIAWFAILFTGRYPRALFEFNVGVMRWNWRVGFYVYAALGTDRYPPFSLARGDYPAVLELDYPERLSRAQVLIKWLLAIPHLIVVALLVGDIMLYPIPLLNELGAQTQVAGGYSVVNLLVVIAGFFLLTTGRYPTSFFDFLMGINRWVYRVLAYVSLMSDVYPPFRLDAGPREPIEASETARMR